MAVLSQENVTQLGSWGAGLGGTLLIRDKYDDPGDDAMTRPSVLFGVGTGGLALGTSLAADSGMFNLSPAIDDVLVSYGQTALSAGVFSAFSPLGSSTTGTPSMR